MAKLYAKAPDGSDALLSIVITGFTQSLQQNGWCKLPNGLLIQWRANPSISGDRSSTLSFPISFTKTRYAGVLTIIGSRTGEGSTSAYYNDIDNITKFKFTNDSVGTYISGGSFGIFIGV